MSIDSSTLTLNLTKRSLIAVFVLLFAEFLLIGIVFKHGINFTCRANWPIEACSGPSGVLVSIYSICAALALFAFLFPAPFRTLLSQCGERLWPLGLNITGVLLSMVPVTFMVDGSGTSTLVPALLCWSFGMGALLIGFLLYIAPMSRWLQFFNAEKWRLAPLVVGGALAPYLATLIRPLWQMDTIASATFAAVAYVTQFFEKDLKIHTEYRIIGADNFFIDIAPVCSGVEGIALVTIFVTLYLFLFRSELRFPRVLLLYPIGIMVSAALNIVRIVVLLMIGLNGNPELAVGGFHSHAGWLMFTLVSLGSIALANNVTWLRKSGIAASAQTTRAPLPLFKDPVVSMILPFAIFMFSALLAQAFSQTPGVVYPARAALMAGALLLFLPLYRQLEWRLDPGAIAIGALVGLGWVLIPVAEPDTAPPYGTLTGGFLVLWFFARGIGTTLLVPIIEELFFRGYLEQRLKLKPTLTCALGSALAVAILFALLHGRWAEAFIASFAFSYVMHRTGRVTDAIVSHGVANAVVFTVAAVTQKVHII